MAKRPGQHHGAWAWPSVRLRLALWLVVFATTSSGCSSAAFSNQRRLAPVELTDRASMVRLPAGTFKMGSPHGDPDEYPPHEVRVEPFWIDRTEVRWRDYRQCVQAGACSTTPAGTEADELARAEHPVSGINWFAARKYCAWLGKRLPSETEWEYAARAPDFGVFPWRGAFENRFVNGRGAEDGFEKSAPVGSFPAGKSGHGLLDMAGNVAEWTSDEYRHDRYALRQDGRNRGAGVTQRAPSEAMRKMVIRGGAWADSVHGLRASDRAALDPRLGKNSVGFRCAADPE